MTDIMTALISRLLLVLKAAIIEIFTFSKSPNDHLLSDGIIKSRCPSLSVLAALPQDACNVSNAIV